MDPKEHWNTVYNSRPAHDVSWFQRRPGISLQLLERIGLNQDARVIDVGGGASTLVDELVERRLAKVAVLDVSAAALAVARARLGDKASAVDWIEADITTARLPAQAFDVWHDRAVFHFLVRPEDRAAYVKTAFHAVKPGGHVVVASFAANGPEQCSGLPTMRYAPDELHREFGEPFQLLSHTAEAHQTPFGTVQQFVYCLCRRTPH